VDCGEERRRALITVTEDAKELFLNVDHPDGTVLRLDPVVDQNTGETQIGMSAGEPMSDDQVVEHNGESLLHIAAPVSEALDGSTLDAVNTPEGRGIGITTPDSPPLTDDS
jgi:iron-sulfur cluster assembly protein